MANSAELNIVLKLLDQASDEIKKAMGGVQKETDKTKKKSEEAAKKTESGFKKASEAVRNFRRDMVVVALAVGTLTAVTKLWSERNDEARNSMDEIALASRNALAGFGQFVDKFVSFSGALENVGILARNFNQSFSDTGSKLDAAKTELKNFNEDLKNQAILFQAGKISSEEYYNNILALQDEVAFKNQSAIQNLTVLANIQSQVANTQVLEAQRVTTEQITLLNEYKENYMAAHAGMAAFTATLSQSIRTNLSGAITNIVTGAQDAKEAFAELGKAMISTIVNFMAQKVVAAVLDKTLLAGTVAASVAAAGAIAAAWAPAAAFVSLATFGANSAPAISGITATTAALAVNAGILSSAIQTSLSVGQRFHDGGMVRAHDGLAVDEVPIIAQSGEGILSRRGMKALGGSGNLDKLNQGQGVGGGVNIEINNPRFFNRQDMEEFSRMLGNLLTKESRYAV